MKIVSTIIFLACLPIAILASDAFNIASAELIQCCNEYAQYLGELQEASQHFEQTYSDSPRLLCTSCKTKKMNYGEIVGWIIGRSMESLVDVNKFNVMRKVLIETIEGLSKKTPLELSDFMLHTANDLQVSCSRCQEKNWELITFIAA